MDAVPPDHAQPGQPEVDAVAGRAAADRQHQRRLFSVVLPTYNRADVVMEAVGSVLSQTYVDLELIVVDDHSTDATIAVLARQTDPRLRVVSNPGNQGGAAARNHGTAVARGEWVCFVDSDDLWDVRMLEHLAAGVARAGPEVGVVYGSDHSIDMETGAVRRRRTATLSGMVYPGMLERHFYHHCAAATRRTALVSIGGYDETLGGMEDTDLQHRLTERWEVLAVPEAIYYYRLGRSDQVTKEFADRADKMLLFLAKHLKVLRTLPRAHVKILGVVMLTCLKGGRHAAAASLWLRMMMRSLAAPRLVFTYQLRAAVVLRDRLGRIGRHQGRNLVGAGSSTLRRPSHGVRHLVAVEGPNKRSAEPG